MDTKASTDDATDITNNNGYDGRPDWSPSGEKIAFEGNSGLVVMNKDGSGRKTLVGYGDDPAWSPGGGKIAFTRNVSDGDFYDEEIFVMNKDGSRVKRLTYNASDDYPPGSQSYPERHRSSRAALALGRGVVPRPFPLALIHPSAWNKSSRKFVLRVGLLLYHRLGWLRGGYRVGVTMYNLPGALFRSKDHRSPQSGWGKVLHSTKLDPRLL
jgi:dipeptidyl aminopeptidase/acylaminoacyl peptidase